MMTAFDHIASDYDKDFTYSSIGILQRQKVWQYLETALPEKPISILELNCGTGEDAIYLAQKGHHVVASDLSKQMIVTAKEKAVKLGLEHQIKFVCCNINKIEKVDIENKFDLIFSNFGGLNCVDAMALKKLSIVSAQLLKPGGRFIGVIMPKFCLWESLYFMGKGKRKQVLRRATKGPLQVMINDEAVETWYYSPDRIKSIFQDNFSLKAIKPIGFFLPPSYLQQFFWRKQGLLHKLNKLETAVNGFSGLSRYSDHFLIDLELQT